MIRKILLIFCLCTIHSIIYGQTFITREGNKLTYGTNGPDIFLRGMCMGNQVWANDTFPTDTHKEIDFARIRNLGMNAVRFYMNYVTFEDDDNPFVYKPKGWAWIDTNIVWAKKHNLYLILNIHVPQGGYQSNCGGNALWQVSSNQDRLVALWKAIADRYKNETQIAGFDLLNEPIPVDSLGQWHTLEQRIIDSVRKVDNNHLVFSEKAIALNCNYGFNGPNGNFNQLNDSKLVYSIHTYDPYDYTTQLQAWANTGDGGKYPDESVLSLPSDLAYSTGNYSNPTLPTGNSNWTYYTGVPYTVMADSLIIAKPVFQGSFLGTGKAYFDNITVNEVDAGGNIVQQILTYNFTDLTDISYWSANNDGDTALGHSGVNDNYSVVLSGSSSYASATAYGLPFKVFKGKRYQINGWMKGENIPIGSTAAITTEFYSSHSHQPVFGRDKAYLRSLLLQYTEYPRQNNFPIYYGEFGAVRPCFSNNKGGDIWVTDMMQLFDSLNFHWTYHDYRESGFGLYDGVTGDVDTTTVTVPLEQAFKSYFASIPTDIPNSIIQNQSWNPSVFPNPFQNVFYIENTESSELKLEVFDIWGRSIEKQTVLAGEKAVLGSKEKAGLYIIAIQRDRDKKFLRVVKE